MVLQHLQDWILHPEYLNEDSLEELRSCIVQYPYFQTARLIYLRNLFSLCRVEFDIELAKNAPYIADLSILFYYVRGDLFAIKGYETAEQCGIISSDRTLDLIDRFLSNQSEQSNGKNKLSMVSQEVDYTDMLESMEVEGSDRALLKGHDLIDKFLEGESELSPIIASGNLGKNQDCHSEESHWVGDEKSEEITTQVEGIDDEIDETYFTETLAKIYVRQHRYEKALEIIKKLNLKYPKKNTYFADQIRFLEKLIINAKSK